MQGLCVLVTVVGDRGHTAEPSHLWVVGLVIAVLVVALVSMLAYLKVKGKERSQDMETLDDTI